MSHTLPITNAYSVSAHYPAPSNDSVVAFDPGRGTGHIQKNFTARTVSHWNNLAGAVVESPALATFTIELGQLG